MLYFKKNLVALLLCAGIYAPGRSQNRGEFAIQPNGLMYADSNMKMLSHMVDSLNLRFKVCDISRTFYSDPQGKLWSVEFSSPASDMKELRKDLDNNRSLDWLLTRYKKELSSIDTSLFAVEIAAGQDDDGVLYLSGSPSKGYSREYSLNDLKKKFTPGKWFYRFERKDQYSKSNYVYAYQIPQPLKQQEIPLEYARYIQYVDCMIDTNSIVFLAKKEHRYSGWKQHEQVNILNQYLNNKLHLKRKKNDYSYQWLTEEKVKYAESNLREDAYFLELLNTAVDSCIENDCGNQGLENLAAEFISKKKALELMRHRIVVGQCSQDQSPRLHALNIAVLAAETNSWDIFLRAHLDIMNDRFERKSDGSYAYGGRKTYLKELEELNLDIVDLILGLCLRARNLPDQHYVGTVWRLGWAMTESKDKSVFEEKVIHMLKDNRLDEFNRGLLFILLQSYLDQLDDIELANDKIHQIRKQAGDFSDYLKAAILTMKEREKKQL